MIRRFLAWLWRQRFTVVATPLTRVQTDLTDEIELHCGDWIDIEPAHQGWNVVARVLRDFELHEWPLYHCATLRTAWDLCEDLKKAVASGVPAFQHGARVLEKEVAR